MGETAEERRRRLANAMIRFDKWSNDVLEYRWSLDDYEQMLYNVCEEMIEKVREETDVSLVKEYSKNSFKFI